MAPVNPFCLCGHVSLEHDSGSHCTKCPCFMFRPAKEDDAEAKFNRECDAVIALSKMPTLTASIQ